MTHTTEMTFPLWCFRNGEALTSLYADFIKDTGDVSTDFATFAETMWKETHYYYEQACGTHLFVEAERAIALAKGESK